MIGAEDEPGVRVHLLQRLGHGMQVAAIERDHCGLAGGFMAACDCGETLADQDFAFRLDLAEDVEAAFYPAAWYRALFPIGSDELQIMQRPGFILERHD